MLNVWVTTRSASESRVEAFFVVQYFLFADLFGFFGNFDAHGQGRCNLQASSLARPVYLFSEDLF